MHCRAFSPFVFIDYFTNFIYILHTRRVEHTNILTLSDTAKCLSLKLLATKKRKL